MEIVVDALQNSTGNGIGAIASPSNLKPGDTITITCDPSDTWNLLYDRNEFQVNANGLDLFTSIGSQLFKAGAMVGSFNDGTTFFPVGTSCSIKVLEGGEMPALKLYCADNTFTNNVGAIIAIVEKSS